MDDDDSPGRLEGEPRSLSKAAAKAAKKFGFGKCPLCKERFIKRRDNQRYCCSAHKQEAADRRTGKISVDPRWVARRERQLRLEAGRSAVSAPKPPLRIPTSGMGGRCSKSSNKYNDLQKRFLPLSSGISGLGASRADFDAILTLELANVPLARRR